METGRCSKQKKNKIKKKNDSRTDHAAQEIKALTPKMFLRFLPISYSFLSFIIIINYYYIPLPPNHYLKNVKEQKWGKKSWWLSSHVPGKRLWTTGLAPLCSSDLKLLSFFYYYYFYFIIIIILSYLIEILPKPNPVFLKLKLRRFCFKRLSLSLLLLFI